MTGGCFVQLPATESGDTVGVEASGRLREGGVVDVHNYTCSAGNGLQGDGPRQSLQTPLYLYTQFFMWDCSGDCPAACASGSGLWMQEGYFRVLSGLHGIFVVHVPSKTSGTMFCSHLGSAVHTVIKQCLVQDVPRTGGVAKRWHSTRGFGQVHASSDARQIVLSC